jgi:hypothetical protein
MRESSKYKWIASALNNSIAQDVHALENAKSVLNIYIGLAEMLEEHGHD